jgi:uncharacterized membrane protein
VTLEPLLAAPAVVQVHAFAALGAFAIGLIQLAGPKGVSVHRALGWAWVLIMAAVAVSSFWIHNIRALGDWSAIHLLSILALIMLPLGVLAARRHKVRRHGITMTAIFVGALVIAGAFTLLPGRIMHGVVF